jgi:hypothetical protein
MKDRKEKALFDDFDPDQVQQLLKTAEILGPDPFSYSSTGFRRPLASSAFHLFANQGTNSVRMVYFGLEVQPLWLVMS